LQKPVLGVWGRGGEGVSSRRYKGGDVEKGSAGQYEKKPIPEEGL
jgi:hypothetical protein